MPEASLKQKYVIFQDSFMDGVLSWLNLVYLPQNFFIQWFRFLGGFWLN